MAELSISKYTELKRLLIELELFIKSTIKEEIDTENFKLKVEKFKILINDFEIELKNDPKLFFNTFKNKIEVIQISTEKIRNNYLKINKISSIQSDENYKSYEKQKNDLIEERKRMIESIYELNEKLELYILECNEILKEIEKSKYSNFNFQQPVTTKKSIWTVKKK